MYVCSTLHITSNILDITYTSIFCKIFHSYFTAFYIHFSRLLIFFLLFFTSRHLIHLYFPQLLVHIHSISSICLYHLNEISSSHLHHWLCNLLQFFHNTLKHYPLFILIYHYHLLFNLNLLLLHYLLDYSLIVTILLLQPI